MFSMARLFFSIKFFFSILKFSSVAFNSVIILLLFASSLLKLSAFCLILIMSAFSGCMLTKDTLLMVFILF